jgi:hypothetical protein
MRKTEPVAVKALRAYVRLMRGQPPAAHLANLHWLEATLPTTGEPECPTTLTTAPSTP